MGSGDYFVFFALGMTLSPNKLLNLILFASLLGIIVSLVFKKNKLPFFPLLFFGYMFVLFGGALL
jgi:prepilin signal peptidase PulO-like enzyme (type II secretory pathway)